MSDVWVFSQVSGTAIIKVFDNEPAAKAQFDIVCEGIRCRPRQTKEVHDRPVSSLYDDPTYPDIKGPVIGQYFFVNQREYVQYRKQKVLTTV